MSEDRARLPLPYVSGALREIGEGLGQWRRLMNMPTATLAERSGVSVRTIRRVEAGESTSFESILALANELGLLSTVRAAFDPWQSEHGRALTAQHLPRRATGVEPGAGMDF